MPTPSVPSWITLLNEWDSIDRECSKNPPLETKNYLQLREAIEREMHVGRFPEGDWLWSCLDNVSIAFEKLNYVHGANGLTLYWHEYIADVVLATQKDFVGLSPTLEAALWEDVWTRGCEQGASRHDYLLNMCQKHDWCWDHAIANCLSNLADSVLMPRLLTLPHRPGPQSLEMAILVHDGHSLIEAAWTPFAQTFSYWLTDVDSVLQTVDSIGTDYLKNERQLLVASLLASMASSQPPIEVALPPSVAA